MTVKLFIGGEIASFFLGTFSSLFCLEANLQPHTYEAEIAFTQMATHKFLFLTLAEETLGRFVERRTKRRALNMQPSS